jgi:hypothetical protein
VTWVRDGEREVPVDVQPGFRLGVKWPAFWRYLDLLPNTRFLVCVRDPVAVIASMAATGGRLAQGFDYDVAFNHAMNTELGAATRLDSVRRALLYEYVNSRILPHINRPNVKVVHYERWHRDPETLLSEVSEFLGLEGLGQAVRLEPPSPWTDRESIRALVDQHCPSAAELGYPLEP